MSELVRCQGCGSELSNDVVKFCDETCPRCGTPIGEKEQYAIRSHKRFDLVVAMAVHCLETNTMLPEKAETVISIADSILDALYGEV